MPKFEITEGSPQEKAFLSDAPIQLYAGGYGWGKSALMVVKAIKIMLDYPGCHGAVLRNTEQNLNTTTLKEFLKWCPKNLISKYPSSKDKHLVFKNGSSVLFSYIKMTVRDDSKTMNLLFKLKKIWHATNIGGTNGDVLAIRINENAKNNLDSRFLYHLLASDDFFNYN